MRRWLLVVTLLVAVLALGGLAAAQPRVLRVGASTLPHAPILEFVKPMLAEEGIELQIIEFSDYVLPNLALAQGEIDANFFQHVPYLEDFAANHRLDLTWTEKVFIAPIGLYSNKIDSIDELQRGARIAIPNDVSNGGRALMLLAQAGLLELREGVTSNATVFDIVRNPLNLRIIELEAPLLPRALDDSDAAFINQTYALEVGLKPTQDRDFAGSGRFAVRQRGRGPQGQRRRPGGAKAGRGSDQARGAGVYPRILRRVVDSVVLTGPQDRRGTRRTTEAGAGVGEAGVPNPLCVCGGTRPRPRRGPTGRVPTGGPQGASVRGGNRPPEKWSRRKLGGGWHVVRRRTAGRSCGGGEPEQAAGKRVGRGVFAGNRRRGGTVGRRPDRSCRGVSQRHPGHLHRGSGHQRRFQQPDDAGGHRRVPRLLQTASSDCPSRPWPPWAGTRWGAAASSRWLAISGS